MGLPREKPNKWALQLRPWSILFSPAPTRKKGFPLKIASIPNLGNGPTIFWQSTSLVNQRHFIASSVFGFLVTKHLSPLQSHRISKTTNAGLRKSGAFSFEPDEKILTNPVIFF